VVALKAAENGEIESPTPLTGVANEWAGTSHPSATVSNEP
jgi:hypothetical protein